MTKILRSNLVAAHIWGNVLNYQDPDPTQYGWIIGRSTEHLVADLANKEEELGTLVKTGENCHGYLFLFDKICKKQV